MDTGGGKSVGVCWWLQGGWITAGRKEFPFKSKPVIEHKTPHTFEESPRLVPKGGPQVSKPPPRHFRSISSANPELSQIWFSLAHSATFLYYHKEWDLTSSLTLVWV